MWQVVGIKVALLGRHNLKVAPFKGFRNNSRLMLDIKMGAQANYVSNRGWLLYFKAPTNIIRFITQC